MKMFILEQFNRNLPYFWERVSVQGMLVWLVWFSTKDFVDSCFRDNSFIYLFISYVPAGFITTIFTFTRITLHEF